MDENSPTTSGSTMPQSAAGAEPPMPILVATVDSKSILHANTDGLTSDSMDRTTPPVSITDAFDNNMASSGPDDDPATSAPSNDSAASAPTSDMEPSNEVCAVTVRGLPTANDTEAALVDVKLTPSPVQAPASPTEVDGTTTASAGNEIPPQTPGTVMTAPTPLQSVAQPQPKVHPEAAQIIRQIEFYLSDENLPGDAHLLARTGPTGDGWMSINELFGFKKMRNYKPRALAKEALKMSEKLEVHGKFVRRKDPLTVPLHVTPAVNEDRVEAKVTIDKPWLTKGMLKPTGFEEGATEGPLNPEEYAAERKIFDPDQEFTIRIEYAVTRYMSKRKMHQKTANIFVKFLLFGGFEGGQNQFTGGFDEKAMEEYDNEEIMQMKAQYGLADQVLDGVLETDENGQTYWSVNFEGMAKAFLSSEFFQNFDWTEENGVIETTNILKNFYNYLLYHDVAPEYEKEILKAREVCNIAAKELPMLAKASHGLPGRFNKACSTHFGGYAASIRVADPTAEWVHAMDDPGLSDRDAGNIFRLGITAHRTVEQLDILEAAEALGSVRPKPVHGHDVGLEVVAVEFGDEEARKVYASTGIRGTKLDRPTGVLHCVHWDAPNQAPMDLSKARKAELKALRSKKYQFIIEEEILRFCYPGMKMLATVMELEEIGLTYIDFFDKVYPSFHTYTLNEFWRDAKPIGPPEPWMVRANDRDAERGGIGDQAVSDAVEEGESGQGGADADEASMLGDKMEAR